MNVDDACTRFDREKGIMDGKILGSTKGYHVAEQQLDVLNSQRRRQAKQRVVGHCFEPVKQLQQEMFATKRERIKTTAAETTQHRSYGTHSSRLASECSKMRIISSTGNLATIHKHAMRSASNTCDMQTRNAPNSSALRIELAGAVRFQHLTTQ